MGVSEVPMGQGGPGEQGDGYLWSPNGSRFMVVVWWPWEFPVPPSHPIQSHPIPFHPRPCLHCQPHRGGVLSLHCQPHGGGAQSCPPLAMGPGHWPHSI